MQPSVVLDVLWRGLRRYQHLLVAAASLGLLVLALSILHHDLAQIHLSDIRSAIGQISRQAIGIAILGAFGSYLVLTGYDVLALRYLKRTLPYPRVALVSFIATAIGHNVGMAVLSAGAIRLRLYTALGLGAAEVAMLAALVGLTFGVGVTFAGGLVLLLEPEVFSGWTPLSESSARSLGLALVSLVVVCAGLGIVRRRPIKLGSWQWRLPGTEIALGQVVLAGLDLAFSALVLYALLPESADIGFAAFLGIYVMAVVAGMVSHVPGGLGVFEAVLLLALPDIPRDELLASILLYRLIYYLVPLGLAALLAAGAEGRVWRAGASRQWAHLRRLMDSVAPIAVAGAVFVTGAILLFSGALAPAPERIHLLRGIVPLAALEASHLVGSLAGVALIILAHALYRRIKAAHHVAFGLLLAGIAASLLKGLDYEEALVALLVLSVLWLGRHAFNRTAALTAAIPSRGWLVAVLLVLVATTWLGLFAHKHLEYTNDLWWQISFDDHVSRSLRSTLLAMLVALGVGMFRLTRPAPPEPGLPGVQELELAARIVSESPRADAALALLGDKRLLFAGDRGLLMYQVRGRSWVALGDPLGPPVDRDAVASRFRELADRHGGRTVFYQVTAERLPLYLDMGLSAVKLGEEGMVPLRGFTLDGPARKSLRQSYHRAQREGLRFEIVPAHAVQELIPQLREISDAWLASRHTHEKGFSLGYFAPEYLRRFPCALVWQQDRLLAFANLLAGAGRAELSIDLMRYVPGAPGGLMDYLFLELMLHGTREGYEHFSLGMTPLAGLETHPLAPAWHRAGTLIFRHGEFFYNFQGLRAYKAKFDPVWHPRYLALHGTLALPSVLLDVAALIAGGFRGVFLR